MRKFTMTISALALSSGMAHAGGMVVPQEPMITAPAPMMAATYDWTGGYAGLGLTFGRSNFTSGLAFDGVEFENEDNAGGEFWPNGSGWGIGGFAGFNWQAGNIVYGVEGHLSGHRMRGSTTFSNGNGEPENEGEVVALQNGPEDSFEVRTNIRSIASLRGRVGFAADRTLFFVTAGPAIASVRHSATDVEDGVVTDVSESRSVNGLMIGAGVEHALAGGWHIRGDLEHYRFRNRTFNTGEDFGVTFPNVRTRANIARVSAVFRF